MNKKEVLNQLFSHVKNTNKDMVSVDPKILNEVLKLIETYFPEYEKAIANFVNDLAENLDALTPKANYFSPKLAETKVENTLVNFGDGGLSDNFGLMALLRRKVKKVVIFVNTGTEFKLLEDNTYQIDDSVQAFFGIYKKQTEIDGIHLNNMKVFDKSNYENLENQFAKCLNNGDTLVATTKHQVLENKDWDVAGDYDVEIMWYYNCSPENWENKVDTAVMEKLNNEKGIGTFPFYDTFPVTILGMDPFSINMSANLAEWNLKNTEKQLMTFLKDKAYANAENELAYHE